MVIECSSCHARFKLADEKVKESGTRVRCTKCREVFTVFPETPLLISSPVVAVAPVITPETDWKDDFFTETSPGYTKDVPSSAENAPVADEDDWLQETNSSHFADDAGASDLDAINFDNFEVPIFSVTTEKSSELEFADDTVFSFEDSSTADGTEQQYQISTANEDQNIEMENAGDFDTDFSVSGHSITTPEVMTESPPIETNNEFNFPATENLTDFSLGEANISPQKTNTSEITAEKQIAPQDTAFDFSSFSFDDVSVSAREDDDDSKETIALREMTIELSTESETLSEPPDLISPPSPESLVFLSTQGDKSEVPSPSTRQIRPRMRSRKKKKGGTRLIFKVIFLIFLVLALVYGIMNRDQLQKKYKNKVGGFIESQVPTETTGKIGLVKLSGGYLLNNQEGDLFVIRGEAVNEFKGLRSSILVRGMIYGKNGEVLQSQSAYAGNPLPDSNLKKLGFKEIRNIMNKELGENLVNLNIASGKNIPFTIVFNKVPKNITEFTVEVLESKTGSK